MAMSFQTVQAALDWVSERVKEFEMNDSELVVQNEMLHQKVKELEESSRDLVTRNEILQEKLGELEEGGGLVVQLETAHKKVNELEENRWNLAARNETLQEQVQELEVSNGLLGVQIETLHQKVNELEELEVSNGLLGVQIETLHQKVNELEEGRSDLVAPKQPLQDQVRPARRGPACQHLRFGPHPRPRHRSRWAKRGALRPRPAALAAVDQGPQAFSAHAAEEQLSAPEVEMSSGLVEQTGALHKRVNELEGNSRDLMEPHKILQEGADSLGMSGELAAQAETSHKKVNLVARKKVLQVDKSETSLESEVDELRGNSRCLQSVVGEPQEKSQQLQTDVVGNFASAFSQTEKPACDGTDTWTSSWEERKSSGNSWGCKEERENSDDSPGVLPSPRWPRGSVGWGGQKRGRYEEELRREPSSKQVKVENIPPNFDRRKWRELKSVFESAGKIEESELDRGVAWISFQREEDAQKAVKKFNGIILNCNAIQVSMEH